MIQSIQSDCYPLDVTSKKNKRFRLSYADHDSIHRNDMDAIRLTSQFLKQPSFVVKKVQFIGTPREHFRISEVIAHLPIIKIPHEIAKTQQVIMKIKKYNQNFDCLVVSTKDISLIVNNKEIKNIYTDNHYNILRLRKQEGIELEASLEWNMNDDITSSKMVLLSPKLHYDEVNKMLDIIIESRGFWTATEVLRNSIDMIRSRLAHYITIIEFVVTNPSGDKKTAHETDYTYDAKINAEESIYSLEIETPTMIDFDLHVKNVLAHCFNSNPNAILEFEYFSKTIQFTFADKKTIDQILKTLKLKLDYWDLCLKNIMGKITTKIISKKDDPLYCKFYD